MSPPITRVTACGRPGAFPARSPAGPAGWLAQDTGQGVSRDTPYRTGTVTRTLPREVTWKLRTLSSATELPPGYQVLPSS
jgi:hypothetical protein